MFVFLFFFGFAALCVGFVLCLAHFDPFDFYVCQFDSRLYLYSRIPQITYRKLLKDQRRLRTFICSFRARHRYLLKLTDILIARHTDFEIDKCIKNLQMLVEQSHDNLILASACFHLAKCYRLQAQIQKCCLQYRLAVKFAKKAQIQDKTMAMANMYASLAYALMDAKRLSQARKYMKHAHRRQPRCPEIIHGRACLESSHRLFAQAALEFCYLNSENARLYYDWGQLLVLNQDRCKAMEKYNRGLELEPSHVLLLSARGDLHNLLGSKECALRDFHNGLDYHYSDAPYRLHFQNKIQNVVSQSINQFSHSITCRSQFTRVITCYICYAWGDTQHEDWVEQLARRLRDTGQINVLLDKWCSPKNECTMDFVEQLLTADFVLVMGSRLLPHKAAFRAKAMGQREHVLAVEMDLIKFLIGFNHMTRQKVVPILADGEGWTSFPPLLQTRNAFDLIHGNVEAEWCRLVMFLQNRL